MAAFESSETTLTTTPTKIAEAAEFDRLVVLTANNGTPKIGYSSSTLCSLFQGGLDRDFPLPARQELWAAVPSGGATLSALVTVK